MIIVKVMATQLFYKHYLYSVKFGDLQVLHTCRYKPVPIKIIWLFGYFTKTIKGVSNYTGALCINVFLMKIQKMKPLRRKYLYILIIIQDG